MDLLEVFLGQIPEAIYFALFMIFVKELKTKKFIFILLMTFQYLTLKYFIHFSIWFQALYTIITYIILKFLYKDKSQIIDIFTFTIGSIILILICGLLYFPIWKICNNYLVYAILTRIVMFGLLFGLKDKWKNVQKIYKMLWNRNDKIKKKMKSVTFRAANIVIFNILFYIINIGMVFILVMRGGV